MNHQSVLSHTWEYWRPQEHAIREMGTVHGREVALPPHFHDEDQITLVLRGRRRFMIAGRPVEVRMGEAARIPAGTPHSSFDDQNEMLCLNVYLTEGTYDADGVLAALSRFPSPDPAAADLHLLETAVARYCSPGEGLGLVRDPFDMDGTVAHLAEKSHMSREGFSRYFKRVHGLSPHAFQLIARLNYARALLRAGMPPADASQEAGFSDQSHMGRNFLRFFGTTPGLFRAGTVTSVLFSRLLWKNT